MAVHGRAAATLTNTNSSTWQKAAEDGRNPKSRTLVSLPPSQSSSRASLYVRRVSFANPCLSSHYLAPGLRLTPATR